MFTKFAHIPITGKANFWYLYFDTPVTSLIFGQVVHMLFGHDQRQVKGETEEVMELVATATKQEYFFTSEMSISCLSKSLIE